MNYFIVVSIFVTINVITYFPMVQSCKAPPLCPAGSSMTVKTAAACQGTPPTHQSAIFLSNKDRFGSLWHQKSTWVGTPKINEVPDASTLSVQGVVSDGSGFWKVQFQFSEHSSDRSAGRPLDVNMGGCDAEQFNNLASQWGFYLQQQGIIQKVTDATGVTPAPGSSVMNVTADPTFPSAQSGRGANLLNLERGLFFRFHVKTSCGHDLPGALVLEIACGSCHHNSPSPSVLPPSPVPSPNPTSKEPSPSPSQTALPSAVPTSEASTTIPAPTPVPSPTSTSTAIPAPNPEPNPTYSTIPAPNPEPNPTYPTIPAPNPQPSAVPSTPITMSPAPTQTAAAPNNYSIPPPELRGKEKRCTITGDPHVKTFDDVWVSVMKTGFFNVLSTEQVDIVARFEPCVADGSMHCTHSVAVRYRNSTMGESTVNYGYWPDEPVPLVVDNVSVIPTDLQANALLTSSGGRVRVNPLNQFDVQLELPLLDGGLCEISIAQFSLVIKLPIAQGTYETSQLCGYLNDNPADEISSLGNNGQLQVYQETSQGSSLIWSEYSTVNNWATEHMVEPNHELAQALLAMPGIATPRWAIGMQGYIVSEADRRACQEACQNVEQCVQLCLEDLRGTGLLEVALSNGVTVDEKGLYDGGSPPVFSEASSTALIVTLVLVGVAILGLAGFVVYSKRKRDEEQSALTSEWSSHSFQLRNKTSTLQSASVGNVAATVTGTGRSGNSISVV